MEVELLPCPFCGSEPVKIEWQPEGCETGECCCPATGPSFECAIEGIEYTFDDWNKMAYIETPRGQMVEKLAEQLFYIINPESKWWKMEDSYKDRYREAVTIMGGVE